MLLAPSGDRVGWSDVIELLRNLNVATRNNLESVFALCFGLHVNKQVSLKKPVPSYLFFAPPSEITVGFLEALAEAAAWADKNRDKVAAALHEVTGVPLDAQTLAANRAVRRETASSLVGDESESFDSVGGTRLIVVGRIA